MGDAAPQRDTLNELSDMGAANSGDYEILEKSIDPELQEVQAQTEAPILALVDPVKAEEMDEMKKEMVRQRILRQLDAARTAEAKVRILAKWSDKNGGDALLSTFLPIVGDLASSFGSIAYLMKQAKEAGLSEEAGKKITKKQILTGVSEGVAGMVIPGFGGLLTNYLLQANSGALKIFREHRMNLEKEAREAGIEEEAIRQLEAKAVRLEESMSTLRDLVPDFLKSN